MSRARGVLVAVAVAFGVLGTCAGTAMAEEFDRYALESVSASLSSTQAGAHADLTTFFKLTHREGGKEAPYALTRDVVFELPPGMLGNPQAIPRCTIAQMGNLPKESECPIDSQVGVTELRLAGEIAAIRVEPIYNLEPPTGETDVVARLGFFAATYPTFVNIRVDPVDYHLVASVEGVSSGAGLAESTTTLWGVPAAPSHDALRITASEAEVGEFPAGGRKATLPPTPFLSNPTDCSLQRQLTVTARSYQLPGQPTTMSAPFPRISGCGALSFRPTLTLSATNPEASAPTGIDADVTIPQDETAQGRATSNLRSATVTLPEGFTINPAAGDGLAACSAAEVGFERNESAHCPDAGKIGSAEIEVPALEHVLHGSVFQRTPEPGNLFRFWLVADELGVHLKLPAQIQLDPKTGQVTTVFAGIPSLGGLPQVPVSEIKLHVFGGPTAPLATPAGCGTYQVHSVLTPWSGGAPVEEEVPTRILTGCGKGGFSPGFAAGMSSLRAGSFSPFSFTLTRQDGEGNPKTITLHMPQGLLAKLAGVPLCGETEAATAACPASSQIGTVAAAAGVGGAPLWIPQPGKSPTAVYLAGPYHGAPYSIVAKVPAQAGPFDLGTVINRAGIYVDPETAQVTVTTDPLPQILEGVPVLYRAIHVEITRPDFTLNPTSCAPKSIGATVTASNGTSASPSTAFQATNCAKLRFKPSLKISLKGATKRIGHPALKAVLTYPKGGGYSNIARAQVNLPHSEFLDQGNLNKTCTKPVLLAGGCPASTVYGKAKAWTPLLEKPLEGNVYLVGGYGYKLPALVAELDGQIKVLLVGKVDSGPNKGIRNTFEAVPDAPVEKFELRLKGGKKYSLLENSENLCAKPQKASARFVGQNGRVTQLNPTISVNCKTQHRTKPSHRQAR